MQRAIARQARLVEALAGSITNEQSWANEILIKCDQMRKAIEEIEREARKMQAGER